VFKRISLVVYSVLLSTAAVAQQAEFQKLSAALEKAQRESVRRGDEKLDCPALEKQLIEQVTAPSVQDFIEKTGEQAAKDQERAKPDAAKMTGQAALTAFSSLAPGGGWASLMASAMQMQGMQAQTAQNVQQGMQRAEEIVKVLPQLLRGQRVIELAQERRCEWLPADVMSPDGSDAGAK
jgi:hypothetical protein